MILEIYDFLFFIYKLMKKHKKHNGYWTKEKCLEESKKYETRTSFQKNSKGCYLSSYRNGWLDEMCSHMINIKKPNGYWTYEKCKEESLKYNKLKDFRINSSTSYDISYKNNWLNEICSHMTYRNHKGYTKIECLEESKKYMTKKEFKQYNNSMYIFSYRNGWLNEICDHMNFKKLNGYWTYEKCKEESKKYTSKKDLRKFSISAYNSSLKNGWLSEICSHMITIGNRYKRCIYTYEFSDKSVYVGLTYNIVERNKNHLTNGPVHKYINKTKLEPNLIQLTDYIEVYDAKMKESEYVEKYKNDGWNILNKAKAGAVGSNNIIWTYEKCKEVSKLCENIQQFYTNFSGAYYNVCKYGWKDELCSHMIRKIKPNGYWTKEKCQEESLKYKTRTNFQRNSVRAYKLCLSNNWLDDFCSHMKSFRQIK